MSYLSQFSRISSAMQIFKAGRRDPLSIVIPSSFKQDIHNCLIQMLRCINAQYFIIFKDITVNKSCNKTTHKRDKKLLLKLKNHAMLSGPIECHHPAKVATNCTVHMHLLYLDPTTDTKFQQHLFFSHLQRHCYCCCHPLVLPPKPLIVLSIKY